MKMSFLSYRCISVLVLWRIYYYPNTRRFLFAIVHESMLENAIAYYGFTMWLQDGVTDGDGLRCFTDKVNFEVSGDV